MKSIYELLVDAILGRLPHDWQDNIFALRRFNLKRMMHPDRQLLIAVIDGRGFQGGLCDRLKGIVSLFHYCLLNAVAFKINHISPFELSDYLLPNEYDWKLSPADKITHHLCEAKYISLIADPSARRLVRLNTRRQIHAKANRDIVDELNAAYQTHYTWGELFKKLFKPTDELRDLIRNCRSKIGGEYCGAVFRFQNLLGDFVEYKYSELPDEAKTALIAQCRQSILDLQQTVAHKRILVTADSALFLQSVADMDHVFAFPSKIVHLDTAKGEAHEVYLKSFLDFYLLSEGVKVYSIGTAQMYKSEFPLYAAKLNNVPFERILIN
ncbi:hypothetical protein SAMD00024442_33_4 [Candidatus Symbiothrix dinenymphae]|nr:hypothetical protein SAMD00024442_33_4 [Candidatus Symbiothrix dinenymphae]